MRPSFDTAFRAALCAAVLFGGWRALGAFGLVLGMPVLALMAQPLLELLASFPRFAARQAMRRYEGRFYAFRERQVDIHVDDEARCWVSTSDARKHVDLPADAVLAHLLPHECGQLGEPAAWRITTEGLATVLAKSTDPEVTKFRDWLERDVARPARNKRQRGMALR